jgi:hypothetical protein
MRLARFLVVAGGLTATLVSSAPLPASSAPRPVAVVVHELVFDTPLADFVRTATSPSRDRRLDWRTDLCSAPVIESSGRSFDFSRACRRHDFAYRNLSRMDGGGTWTSDLRARVDAVFRTDMRADCLPRRGTLRVRCMLWAETYYRAVRIYAGP